MWELLYGYSGLRAWRPDLGACVRHTESGIPREPISFLSICIRHPSAHNTCSLMETSSNGSLQLAYLSLYNIERLQR